MSGSRKNQQSMYDKILTICQEGSRKLKAITTELERERLQAAISYSLEKNKIKRDLSQLRRERQRLAREPWQTQMETVRRQRGITEYGDDKGTRQKLLKSYQIEKRRDIFPKITCTQANVPKILRRSISAESEFHNWMIGLPKIDNNCSSTLRLPKRGSVSKKKSKRTQDGQSERELIKRSSIVQNISYSVPVSLENKARVSNRQDTERAVKVLLSRYCSALDKTR